MRTKGRFILLLGICLIIVGLLIRVIQIPEINLSGSDIENFSNPGNDSSSILDWEIFESDDSYESPDGYNDNTDILDLNDFFDYSDNESWSSDDSFDIFDDSDSFDSGDSFDSDFGDSDSWDDDW